MSRHEEMVCPRCLSSHRGKPPSTTRICWEGHKAGGHALQEGLPLSLCEARLARAQLAVARREQGARIIVREALELAEDAAHLASAIPLRQLLAEGKDS